MNVNIKPFFVSLFCLIFIKNGICDDWGIAITGDLISKVPGCEINYKRNNIYYCIGQTGFGYYSILKNKMNLYDNAYNMYADSFYVSKFGTWISPLKTDRNVFENYYFSFGYEFKNIISILIGISYQRKFAWQSFDFGIEAYSDSSISVPAKEEHSIQFDFIESFIDIPIGIKLRYKNFPLIIGGYFLPRCKLFLLNLEARIATTKKD